MAPLDLFAIATANEAALSEKFEARRTAMVDHAERLDLFCQSVKEHSGIGVNMKPYKLIVFLRRGRYLSIYEIADELAAASGRSSEDELRSMQGSYYERRVFFDRSFEDGERFLYGALNIGGAGASEYGLFCAFMGEDQIRAIRSAFVPDNSLERYVSHTPDLTLNEEALRQEVATPAQRHCLAALKHADELIITEPPNWAAMLCSRERFVEVIFVGDISPSNVTELRIKQDELRRLSDLAFDDMMGTLAPSDRVELDQFREAMELLESMGVSKRIREV